MSYALAPWQSERIEAILAGRRIASGRSGERRASIIGATAMALATGETVKVLAASEADAEKLMDEARRLCDEWVRFPLTRTPE